MAEVVRPRNGFWGILSGRSRALAQPSHRGCVARLFVLEWEVIYIVCTGEGGHCRTVKATGTDLLREWDAFLWPMRRHVIAVLG